MVEADKAEFAAVLKTLADGLGTQLTKHQYEFYWAALQPLSLEQVKDYVVRLSRECKFMPKPAEFFAIAKAERTTWADSWTEILANRGATSDPIGQRALRALGGWMVVGFSNADRIPFLASQFRDIYQTMAEAAPVEERLLGAPKSVPAISDLTSKLRLTGTQKRA